MIALSQEIDHILYFILIIIMTPEELKKLKGITINQPEKTKEDLGNQAKMYEELRQIMSTKEFVEQYNNGLEN